MGWSLARASSCSPSLFPFSLFLDAPKALCCTSPLPPPAHSTTLSRRGRHTEERTPSRRSWLQRGGSAVGASGGPGCLCVQVPPDAQHADGARRKDADEDDCAFRERTRRGHPHVRGLMLMLVYVLWGGSGPRPQANSMISAFTPLAFWLKHGGIRACIRMRVWLGLGGLGCTVQAN